MRSDFHVHFPLEANGISDYEDFYFSKLAEKLDKDDVKTYSHEDAWK